MPKTKIQKNPTLAIEEKLRALNDLQTIDTQIDNIRIVRGELPLEIEDLEVILQDLEVNLDKQNDELIAIDDEISQRKNTIKDSKSAIKKYQKQLDNIKNNREFTSLSKEIEYQTLDIELNEKRIKEADARKITKLEVIDDLSKKIKEKKKDLKLKKDELEEIVKETEKEEKSLMKKSKKAQESIDERIFLSYKRIRKKVRNGLAVVSISRNACGGCFNTIPSQRQLEIRLHKDIITCEHCGRILIDAPILTSK